MHEHRRRGHGVAAALNSKRTTPVGRQERPKPLGQNVQLPTTVTGLSLTEISQFLLSLRQVIASSRGKEIGSSHTHHLTLMI